MAVAFGSLTPFLDLNAAWAANLSASMPNFLPDLAQKQTPPMVWIGCADSRVPESVIMDVLPGNVFTTRNIANQFHDDDDSAHAVLEYGIGHLNASHVVVVGHTNCGGAAAAFAAPNPAVAVNGTEGQTNGEHHKRGGHDNGKGHGNGHGHGKDDKDDGPEHEELATETEPLDRFLAPLVKLRYTLPANSTVQDLIVANVKATVLNVVNSTTIASAWDTGRKVCVHGWLYNLTSGLLSDLSVTQCNQ